MAPRGAGGARLGRGARRRGGARLGGGARLMPQGPRSAAKRRPAGAWQHGAPHWHGAPTARHSTVTVSSQRGFAQYAMLYGRVLGQPLPVSTTFCSELFSYECFGPDGRYVIEGQDSGRFRLSAAGPAINGAGQMADYCRYSVNDSVAAFAARRQAIASGGRAERGGGRQGWRAAGRQGSGDSRSERGLASITEVRAPLAQLAEQQTLNLRVRGSSPWRRTHSDLGFYRSGSDVVCPICPHVGSVLARVSGPGHGGLVTSGRFRAQRGAVLPELAG